MKKDPTRRLRPPLPIEAEEVPADEIGPEARNAVAPALAKLIAQAVRRGIEIGELIVEDGVVRVNSKRGE